jgi:hypothetical protein
MNKEEQTELEWNDFAGDYIKAENIKQFPVKLIVIGLTKEHNSDGKSKLIAEVEYSDRTWKFDLNKTNRDYLMDRFTSPSEVIGKVLVCDRVKVKNPRTNMTVWSITIDKVE